MDRRPDLHQFLKTLFNNEPHVYHQRPSNGRLEYPCIIYKLDGYPEEYADNIYYFEHRRYQMTVIDPDPDSKLREKVAQLKWCKFERSYVSDNLNHFVFSIYY